MDGADLPPPPGGELPPPPPGPVGGPGGGIPNWRTTKPGWILLHIAISLGITFASLIVVFAIIDASRDVSALQDVSSEDPDLVTAAGLTFWVVLIGSVAGWMLFVYLRTSSSSRVIALIAGIAAPIVIGVILLMGALPGRV